MFGRRLKVRFCSAFVAFIYTGILYAAPDTVIGHSFDKFAFDKVLPVVTEKHRIDIAFKTLPEPYTLNTEYELIYSQDVSIVDLLNPSISRFDEAGWLTDLSQFPELVAASEQQYASLRVTKYRNGRLLGLGHNTMLSTIPLIEMGGYSHMGLGRDDFPETWDELYNQVLDLADQGHRGFFYPAWFQHNHGIALSFLVELWNRDAKIVDPASLGVFPKHSESVALEMLRNWRNVWRSGAVPEKMIDQTLTAFRADYMKNPYPIGVLGHDMLLSAKSAGRPGRNLVTLVPQVSQSWGTAISSIQTLVRKADSPPSPAILSAFLEINKGTGDDLFLFARTSLQSNGLLSAYREFMEGDEAEAILVKRLQFSSDIEVLLDIYEKTEYAEYWSIPWHEELTSVLMIELKRFLGNPEITPQQTVDTIRREVFDIKEKFGY